MGSLNGFLEHMDWFQLFLLLIGAVACLFCITFHELAHGFAAWQPGGPHRQACSGRLTHESRSAPHRPARPDAAAHRAGWAGPSRCRWICATSAIPKRDMAITALAGPVANFLHGAAAALGVRLPALSLRPDLRAHGRGSMPISLLPAHPDCSAQCGLGDLQPDPVSRPWTAPRSCSPCCPTGFTIPILRYERYLIAGLCCCWSCWACWTCP